ncbi:MAG TPA: sugar transferase [Chthoniobacterales bacterium]|nr:sugar transferase [Chthoniobacterales bacterium]
MNQTIRKSILVLDLFWIATAFSFAYALRYKYLGFGVESWTSFRGFLPALTSALLIWTTLYFSKNLEGFRGGWHLPTVFSQTLVGVFYLMSFLLALAFLQRHYYSRLLLLYLACLLPVGLVAIRCAARWAISSGLRTGTNRRTAILGCGHLAHELAYKISRHPEMLLEVVGLIYPGGSDSLNGLTTRDQELTSLQSLNVPVFLHQKGITELIVVMPQPAGIEVEKVISKCREAGMVVRLVPQWYELYVSEAQMIEVDGVPLISLEERNVSVIVLGLKRILDLIGGVLLAVLSSPVLLMAAVSLKRHSGRAFTEELRCGKAGAPFRMFRLNVDRENPGPSNLNKLLARLSLTELPQLWNVLRGDMSLVGPRPESPERVRHYSDWQRQRLSVTPGLTGLAQVHGLREQHSSEEKARFDLEYIFHCSLFLDFSLLLQTAWTLAIRLLKLPQPKRLISPDMLGAAQLPLKEVLHVDSSQSSAD